MYETYIDQSYYDNEFGGTPALPGEFHRLAEAASRIIEGVANQPIHAVTDGVRLAVAYQTEMLIGHGGIEAAQGLAPVSGGINTSLGDLSVTSTLRSGAQSSLSMLGGVPVSAVAVAILRREGLMRRCVCRGTEGRYD